MKNASYELPHLYSLCYSAIQVSSSSSSSSSSSFFTPVAL
jgi:hypothetical protein